MLQNGCCSQKQMQISPRKSGGTCYGQMSPKVFFLVERVSDLLFASHLIVNTSSSSQQKLSNTLAAVLWYEAVFHTMVQAPYIG